jgi:hypothetical protein
VLLPGQLAIVRTSFDEATYVELPDQPEAAAAKPLQISQFKFFGRVLLC